MLEDLREDRGADRVVDDQGETLCVRGVGPGLDVDDVETRVADRLGEHELRVLVDELGDLLRLIRIHEADLDAVLRQRVGKQIVRTAVEGRDADDVVASLGDVHHRVRHGRLAGSNRAGRDTALEGGDALLHHVPGRVHDARVDVARHGQREQVGRVLGVVELVARGLVDRDRNGLRRRVRALTRVKYEGLRLEIGHRLLLCAYRRRVPVRGGPGLRGRTGGAEVRPRRRLTIFRSPVRDMAGVALDEAPGGRLPRLLSRRWARSLGDS